MMKQTYFKINVDNLNVIVQYFKYIEVYDWGKL